MFPALVLSIIAPTRGDHMQVGMVLTIPPVSVDHRDIATLERLASDLAIEVVEALYAFTGGSRFFEDAFYP